MNSISVTAGDRHVLSDFKVLRERARERVERGADDPTSLTLVDVDACARNGDGPGGDNGS